MNRGMQTFSEWTKEICVRNLCVNREREGEREKDNKQKKFRKK